MAGKKKLEVRKKKVDVEVRNSKLDKTNQTSNVQPQHPTSNIKHPTSAKQPQTMEELLAVTGYSLKGVKKGDVVEGAITRVSAREIAVDIGGKTEGVVIDRELENYRDALMALKPGDRVVAQVIVAENDRGQSVLSLRRSIFEKRWVELAEKQKSGQVVSVILKEPVRGGILVDYGGLRGYIPQSQLDSALV
ncbi:MAG: S1 RNA-binding domain-containing protein, partial [Patescibacteria group bacterium]